MTQTVAALWTWYDQCVVTAGIRFITLLTAVSFLCPAQTSWERLAASARLWVYVKYFHPRVTAPGVDWDRAFVTAAPRVLDARTDDEFALAVGTMLDTLNDPTTRITQSATAQFESVSFNVRRNELGAATVVRIERANMPRAVESRNSLYARLSGAGAIVFDLRGTSVPEVAMPLSLPVSKTVHGVYSMTRRHDGYAPQRPYSSSSWDSREALNFDSVPGSDRVVFLVNRSTTIPLIALAIQDSGAGAIVSEDPIANEQVELSRSVAVLRNVRAMVRTREILYRDGTTGAVANVVLHQTGDRALQAAADIAISGNWPAPPQRAKLNVPSANFPENGYSAPSYPSLGYRMLAAARIWGVFNYFHPYKYLYERDWDSVLVESLEQVATSGNTVSSVLTEDLPMQASDKPRYRGKTVMLIDEKASSQSEDSGMAYRMANGTLFIGSPTQGVNGPATSFLVPGGLMIGITNEDVRWPDGKQLQRVGLQPDIEVRPTIEGVRAGRDEVLERAISYLTAGR